MSSASFIVLSNIFDTNTYITDITKPIIKNIAISLIWFTLQGTIGSSASSTV